MFSWLESYANVLVTGPQRAGTTICGRMIAHDLGYSYVDENTYGIYNLAYIQSLLSSDVNVVIQCPAHCVDIHSLGARDDTAVVFMLRDTRAILASQDRINWTNEYEPNELRRYGIKETTGKLHIADIKYANWFSWQKLKVSNPFEVEFNYLREHPMWISKKGRVGFKSKQTSL